jgi:ribose/xylose/arabinose/galactoside ABC-type transport system permease subunit
MKLNWLNTITTEPPAAPPANTAEQRRSLPTRIGAWCRTHAAYLVLVALVVVFWVLVGDNFMSARDWTYIMEQVAVLAVLAVAETFVITAGYIDLSVGAALGLSCFAAAWGGSRYGAVGLLLGVGLGLLIGLVNGLIFARVRIPSFIVTLAMMAILASLLRIVSGGKAIYLDPGGPLGWLGILGRFPGVLIVVLVIVAVCWLLYNKTAFGLDLRAMGGSERVSGLLGVSLTRRRVEVFGLVGLLVGVAAIVNLARVGAASPVTGTGLELEAISAVVLGGTPLTGGYGSIVKTVVGALALTVLDNGLTLTGVQPSWNAVVRGTLLIIAIGIALDRKKIGIVK